MSFNKYPKHTVAAYMIYTAGALGLIKYFFLSLLYIQSHLIPIILLNLALFIGLGLLVKQGYSWVKYLLAVLSLAILTGLIIDFTREKNFWFHILPISNLLQRLLIPAATLVVWVKKE